MIKGFISTSQENANHNKNNKFLPITMGEKKLSNNILADEWEGSRSSRWQLETMSAGKA